MTAPVADANATLLSPADFLKARTGVPHAAPGGPVASLAAAARWLARWPRRHAILDELRDLSDRDLADIGLARNELGRVFDPKFAAARRARQARA